MLLIFRFLFIFYDFWYLGRESPNEWEHHLPKDFTANSTVRFQISHRVTRSIDTFERKYIHLHFPRRVCDGLRRKIIASNRLTTNPFSLSRYFRNRLEFYVYFACYTIQYSVFPKRPYAMKLGIDKIITKKSSARAGQNTSGDAWKSSGSKP